MIGINPDYDYLFDPQQAKVYYFCDRCGGEIYRQWTALCDECQKEAENGDEE